MDDRDPKAEWLKTFAFVAVADAMGLMWLIKGLLGVLLFVGLAVWLYASYVSEYWTLFAIGLLLLGTVLGALGGSRNERITPKAGDEAAPAQDVDETRVGSDTPVQPASVEQPALSAVGRVTTAWKRLSPAAKTAFIVAAGAVVYYAQGYVYVPGWAPDSASFVEPRVRDFYEKCFFDWKATSMRYGGMRRSEAHEFAAFQCRRRGSALQNCLTKQPPVQDCERRASALED